MPQTTTVRQTTLAMSRRAACYTSGDSSTYVGATSEGIGSCIARGANAGICPGQFSDKSRMHRVAIALQYTGCQRYRQNAVCHKHGCFEGDEDGIQRVQRRSFNENHEIVVQSEEIAWPTSKEAEKTLKFKVISINTDSQRFLTSNSQLKIRNN
uniref:Uncharacterized protein n=1 Tax=Panagrellus redivivus TaxID=6233 RepID=A0A7E5A0G8_PANRE